MVKVFIPNNLLSGPAYAVLVTVFKVLLFAAVTYLLCLWAKVFEGIGRLLHFVAFTSYILGGVMSFLHHKTVSAILFLLPALWFLILIIGTSAKEDVEWKKLRSAAWLALLSVLLVGSLMQL